jgi:F-type H+-transporting ATPase subunit a
MIHHMVETQSIDLGFTTIDLSPLSFDAFQLFGYPVDLSVTNYVVFLVLAGILTIVTMWYAARKAREMKQGEEAPGGLLNAFEAFYFFLRDDVALDNIGEGGERFVPYVVTLFFFILYANLLGLLPFGATATSSIMVTGALAFISLLVVEYAGFVALGPKGYAKTVFHVPEDLHPVMKGVMGIIMPPVELLGKLTKPFALAVRLYANMNAGHFVLLALLGLIVTYGSFTAATGVTTIVGAILLGLFIMFLEIFVAFLHAYIFTVLTAVFIGLIRHGH